MAAFQKTVEPFKEFMLKHVREKDMQLFTELSQEGPFAGPKNVPLQVLVPAFIISEMRRGFEIGFLLFVPFIIIDMVVASILMAMGMVTLPARDHLPALQDHLFRTDRRVVSDRRKPDSQLWLKSLFSRR